MNEIFFLMWLADVKENLPGFAAILATISIVLGFFHCVNDDFNPRKKQTNGFLIAPVVTFVVFIIVVLAMVFSPSATTIRIMAGGELTKQISASPIGQKTVEAVDAVLSRVIKEAQKE